MMSKWRTADGNQRGRKGMKLKKSIVVLLDNGKVKILPGKQNFCVFSCMYYKKVRNQYKLQISEPTKHPVYYILSQN